MMLKNYLIVGIRNIHKSLLHVSTNVIGLGLGIAMCILAFLLSAYNTEFNDNYNKDVTDNIYRVEYSRLENDKKQYYGSVNVSHTYFLEKEIPGIESVIRFFGRRAVVKYKEERIEEFLNFCNKPFLDAFPLEFIQGSFNEFNDPNAIYLSEQLAEKYFGDKSAIDQNIEVLVKDSEGGIQHFVVRGVFRQPKSNSSFNYIDMLTNFENLYRINNVESKDLNSEIIAETFIRVSNKDVINNPIIFQQLNENATMLDESAHYEFQLTPFREIHKRLEDRVNLTFSNIEIRKDIILTFNLMGIMILLIACFNYTIYAFSSANKRLKEIGVRKVSGSSPKQIMFLFLTESFLLSFLSLLAGIFLSQLIAPLFVDIWGSLPYTLGDIQLVRLLVFLVGITLTMTIVSGFYPALYISRYNPSAILSRNVKMKKTGWVTHSLVLLQQAITILGLGASFIFTSNVYWQENMDFGYEKDNLLTIQGLNSIEKSDVFIDLVKKHPKVVRCGVSWKMLGNGTGDRKVIVDGKEIYVDLLETGPDYIETNVVRLVQGRFWHNESESDMKSTALVNEMFVKISGIKDIIGKKVTLPNNHIVTVIGIIKDYKHNGAFVETEATVIHYALEGIFKFLAIRGNSMEDLEEIDKYCKREWQRLEPFMPYVSMYESGSIVGGLDVSVSFKKTFLFAAGISLLLSIGGMFSLVTMLVQARTKEIAIRKTNGSGVKSLLYLISKTYIGVSLMSGILGSTIGFFLVKGLLDSIYDYHVNVSLFWFLLASFIMLFVTMATISTQTIKAATTNPVLGLRHE